MKKPKYDLLLKENIEYYGDTPAAFEITAIEFSILVRKYYKLFGESGSLLERYIQHVIKKEGTNFISQIHRESDDIHFTDREIQILKELGK